MLIAAPLDVFLDDALTSCTKTVQKKSPARDCIWRWDKLSWSYTVSRFWTGLISKSILTTSWSCRTEGRAAGQLEPRKKLIFNQCWTFCQLDFSFAKEFITLIFHILKTYFPKHFVFSFPLQHCRGRQCDGGCNAEVEKVKKVENFKTCCI